MTGHNNSEVISLIVGESESGPRLDQYLARRLGWSRARLQKLLKSGLVTLNGRPAAASHRVRAGEALQVTLLPPEPSSLIPEALPLDVVYEDRDLIVVNKPPSLVVHPAPGHRGGTLLNALLAHCPELKEMGDVSRPGLVHRLDKDTSGLLVAAKTELAHQALVRQFQEREVRKRYLALVWGRLPQKSGRIEGIVGRHPTQRQKMSVHSRRGKEAVTLWQVVREFPGPLTLVELTPQTGRTHQLRVHLASLGHPVLGDATYGGGVSRLKAAPPRLSPLRPLVRRQLLHAWRLGFTHPRSGEELNWEAPLPEDFQNTVDFLEGVD
ncbi:MAG: RluA family pseudouridine synthase [Deltaproteobacteria bacterium]|nr:RluA family pseudouridine synthase [Deltaproteobacteria bacterium]